MAVYLGWRGRTGDSPDGGVPAPTCGHAKGARGRGGPGVLPPLPAEWPPCPHWESEVLSQRGFW